LFLKNQKLFNTIFLKNDTFQEEGGICQLKNQQLKNQQLKNQQLRKKS